MSERRGSSRYAKGVLELYDQHMADIDADVIKKHMEEFATDHFAGCLTEPCDACELLTPYLKDLDE